MSKESGINDITSPATYFYCDDSQVGSLPFYVPSLFEGMEVSFFGGSATNTYIVKSWRFVASSRLDQKSGLMVDVEVAR